MFPRKDYKPSFQNISPPLTEKKPHKIIYNLFYFLSSALISSEYKNQSLACSSLPNGSQSHSVAGSNTVNHPGKAKILLGFRQQAGSQSLPPANPLLNLLHEVSDGSKQTAMARMHRAPDCLGHLSAYECRNGIFRCCLDTHTHELCSGSL